MAKAKKVSSTSMKTFFAENGEKFVLGFAVLCLLYFAYSAVGGAPITKELEPLAIQEKAKRARAHIDQGEVEPAESSIDVIALADRSLAKVPVSAVEIAPYSPFVFKPFKKRSDPVLYKPEKLVTSAGRGAVALASEEMQGTGMGMSMGGPSGMVMPPSATGMNYRSPPSSAPGVSIPRIGLPGGATSGKAGAKGRRGSPSGSSLEEMMAGSAGPGRGKAKKGKGKASEEELYDPYNMDPSMMDPSMMEAPKTGVDAPGAEPDGRMWAMILATVPLAKQEAAYRTSFDEAQPPDSLMSEWQTPFYGAMEIERAEVSIDGQVSPWQKINVKAFQDYTLRWAPVEVPEVADPEFTDYYLTMPLPPLLDRPWGDEARHPDIPENPMALGMMGQGGLYGMPSMMGPQGMPGGRQNPRRTDEKGDQDEGDEAEEPSRPQMQSLDPFEAATQRTTGAGNMLGGTTGTYIPPGPSYGGGAGGSRMSGMGSMGGMGTGRRPVGRAGADSMMNYGMSYEYGDYEQKIISDLMVRFFDMGVQPGKRYQYRVRLVIGNPNYNVSPRFLENPASSEEVTRKTDWSEVSPVVEIPRAHQVFALSADPSRTGGDPKARVGLVSWHRKLDPKAYPDQEEFGPAEAAVETNLEVGDVATMITNTKVNNTVTKYAEEIKGFQFAANMLLADARGGRVVNRVAEPAELLLLDESGNLIVQKEVEDAPQFNDLKELLEPVEGAPADQGLYGPGGGSSLMPGPPGSFGGPGPGRGSPGPVRGSPSGPGPGRGSPSGPPRGSR